MNNAIVMAVGATVFMSGTAFASDGMELAKEKQCLSCHDVAKTALAPSFKDIAKKYHAQPKFDGKLITQIISGSPTTGGNHWGTMKMPGAGARPEVSVAEANKLLDWILTMK